MLVASRGAVAANGSRRPMEGSVPATLLVLATVMSIWTAGGRAHTYHVGSCPRLDPKPAFNIQRFLGRWYVLQKTSTRVRCLTNDYSWTKPPARPQPMAKHSAAKGRNGVATEWAEEVEAAEARGQVTLLQRMVLPLPAVNHGVRYTGSLKPDPGKDAAGAFLARFPFNMFGSSSYVVFDTDYDNYAVVVSCQRLLSLWHRLSASIMSRKPSLEPSTIDKMRRLLKGQGIDVNDLDVIQHSCDTDAYDKGIQVDIKPKVLQTNVTQILRDTGDAVATVADAAKSAYDVYHTLQKDLAAVTSRRRRRRRQLPEPSDQALLLLRAQWMP